MRSPAHVLRRNLARSTAGALPLLRQQWRSVAFWSWGFDAGLIAPRLPPGLTIDLHGGRAWLTVVSLEMFGTRPPLLPRVPYLSDALGLNVRTYVRGPDGEPGLWFFSLDTSSIATVLGARSFFALPYTWAKQRLRRRDDRVSFESKRRGDRHPSFRAEYVLGAQDAESPEVGSLERFLVERYTTFAVTRSGFRRARVEHAPWKLRPIYIERMETTILDRLGLPGKEAPLAFAGEDRDVSILGQTLL